MPGSGDHQHTDAADPCWYMCPRLCVPSVCSSFRLPCVAAVSLAPTRPFEAAPGPGCSLRMCACRHCMVQLTKPNRMHEGDTLRGVAMPYHIKRMC